MLIKNIHKTTLLKRKKNLFLQDNTIFYDKKIIAGRTILNNFILILLSFT